MIKCSLLLAGLVCCVAVSAMAQTLPQGRYDGFDCNASGGWGSDLRLVLEGSTLEFHESRCQVTGILPIAGMDGTFVFDTACQGEGDQWTGRFIVMSDQSGGVVLIGSGFATAYARCDG